MTDNLQLQTSRLLDASPGHLIDDSLADIENCLRVIFKITADTPIAPVMSITEKDGTKYLYDAGWTVYSGDIWEVAAPIEVTTTFYDLTEGVLVANKDAPAAEGEWFWGAGILYLFNDDSGNDPATTYTTPGVQGVVGEGDVTLLGTLTLAGAPTTDLMCATKKYADDNAGSSGGAMVKVLALSQEIAGGAEDFFEMTITPEIEIGDAGQYDYVTDNTKLICKDAGDYLIVGYIVYDPLEVGTGTRHSPYEFGVTLVGNGGDLIQFAIEQYNDNSVVYDTSRSFAVMLTMAEDDYIQLDVRNFDGDPSRVSYGSYFSMIKVG